MTDEQVNTALFTLIGLGLLFTAVVLVINMLIEDKLNVKDSPVMNGILPGSFLVLGIAGMATMATNLLGKLVSFFPEGIRTRFLNINFQENSVLLRIVFYEDDFVVWRDYFFFGAGGGSWRALYESYKSLPYISTQAHNFYVQTLLEVGLVGSLFVFGFFVYVLYKGIGAYFKGDLTEVQRHVILGPVIVLTLVLLLHSFVDFNMSYCTYNLFLFSLLAVIYSVATSGKKERSVILSKLNMSVRHQNLLIMGMVFLLILSGVFSTYKSYAYMNACP